MPPPATASCCATLQHCYLFWAFLTGFCHADSRVQLETSGHVGRLLVVVRVSRSTYLQSSQQTVPPFLAWQQQSQYALSGLQTLRPLFLEEEMPVLAGIVATRQSLLQHMSWQVRVVGICSSSTAQGEKKKHPDT